MSFRTKIVLFLSMLAYLSDVAAQTMQARLSITHLADSFYVYTTYKVINDFPFPSNSMYLITREGVVLFDTPWDSTQFQPLLDSIQKRHNQKVVLCIATHFHEDRTAGLEFLRNRGVRTYSSEMTYELCRQRHEKQAAYYFTKDTTFSLGGYSFQTYYLGEGHSKDNIVIWFPSSKILYGGCFVKSIENKNLGNIADANLKAWPVSLNKVLRKFPDPAFVIPGHFAWSSKQTALKHTLKLLAENK